MARDATANLFDVSAQSHLTQEELPSLLLVKLSRAASDGTCNHTCIAQRRTASLACACTWQRSSASNADTMTPAFPKRGDVAASRSDHFQKVAYECMKSDEQISV